MRTFRIDWFTIVGELWYSILAAGRLDSAYLFWFRDNDYSTYEYGPAELAELPGMDLVAVREDGFILKGSSAALPGELPGPGAGPNP